MAFSNDEKQEIKDIVLETMTEQSDAVDYTEQVVEFAPGDEVPIVRNGDGTGEKSYGRAPVSMFGGGGSSGVNGIKVGGSGQVLTPTSGVVTLPAYESGAEKNPVKYLKEATISQDGNSLTIKDNNNETKTFTPIGGGGSVTPSDADPLEDGTKSAGSSASYSRGDHRHPHDTTKADKSEMAITPGTGENSDKTTIQLKDGMSTTVLTQHQDITGKVDKVNGKGLSSNDYTTDEKNKLNGIETGAEKHKAPTSQEVKNALGTGSGTTKYLREDGQWAEPQGGGGGNTADVNYDTNNKKITKTIDGVTSDVVTVATLKTDMNLGNVGNFKAVSTVANQGLSDTEKGNARTNIGAGTSNFGGSYNDLSNKPVIPTVPANVSAFNNDAGYLLEQDIASKADKSDTYTKTEVNNLISNTPESDIIVVEVPSGTDIATYLLNNVTAAQRPNNVFRVPGTNSYSEWAWNGTSFIEMSDSLYGFDEKPTPYSTNIVSSGNISELVEEIETGIQSNPQFALTDKLGNIFAYLDKDGFNFLVKVRHSETSFYERNKRFVGILSGACVSVGSKKLQLMILSDTHLNNESLYEPIESVNDFDTIDAVVLLGDYTRYVDPGEDNTSCVKYAIESAKKPVFPTVGNHDVGPWSPFVKYCKDDKQLYNMFIKPAVERGFILNGEYQENKCYYYHDFVDKKVRLIVLYEYDDGNAFDTTYWKPITYNKNYPEIQANHTYTSSDSSNNKINIPGYDTWSFQLNTSSVTTGKITTSSGAWDASYQYVPRFKALRCYDWYSQEQLQWFCSKLDEAGGLGYTCIVCQHEPELSKYGITNVPSRFDYPSYNIVRYDANHNRSNVVTYDYRYAYDDRDLISQIVYAYQTKASISKTLVPVQATVSYDDPGTGGDNVSAIPTVNLNYSFSNSGKVLFLHGHVHIDKISKSTAYNQVAIGVVSGQLDNSDIYRKSGVKELTDTSTVITLWPNKVHISRVGNCYTNRVDTQTNSLISKENEIIDF